MTERHRIVIVGGGIAGIEVATRLGRRYGKHGKAEVTLVDRSLSHVWKPMLHTFAAGTSRLDREKVSFFAQAKANGFHFQPGSLASIDRTARQVHLAAFDATPRIIQRKSPEPLPYDTLVLSLGSRANDFGTAGVARHCLTIDDVAEAEAFRAQFRQHIFDALETGGALDVAIVGGGATGVELAAELKHALDLISGYGAPALRQKLRLTLIESGPRLLPAFPAHVSDAVAQTLSELGIDVRTGVTVTGADAAGYTLKDGARIEAGLKVWAAGVKAPDVLADINGLERSRTGQLMVLPTLQTTQDPAIFALGDCSRLDESGSHRPVPATAQAARQQALHFCRNFPAWQRKQALSAFEYRDKGSIVSLSDYNGWGTLGRYTFGGGRWRGFLARSAHDLLYRQHQFELFGLLAGGAGWAADVLEAYATPPVRLD